MEDESQNEDPEAEPVHLNKVAETILAIDEEEEELGSREEQVEEGHREEESKEAEWLISVKEGSKNVEEQGDSEPQ